MEKAIAQLDSLVTMSYRDSFSDTNSESRAASTEASTSTTIEDVLEICQEQSKTIRELNQENMQLRDTVRQLKLALNYSHELHATATSDKKAACNALIELERQLEMALREKKALDEGLQNASKLLEELRNKSIMDKRKLEQTQSMYDELKERYDVFQKQCSCRKSPSQMSDFIRNELRPVAQMSPDGYIFRPNLLEATKVDDQENGYQKITAERSKEISEVLEQSLRQNEIVLEQQRQEILPVKLSNQQSAKKNTKPAKEEGLFRTFLRRSFSTRRKKVRAPNVPVSKIVLENEL
ncbi:unnamed protein product [Enterobius vermicularis]|uniref:HAP1 N-terminal domain-containing protein n=1 Tax=Enterobius vermicularis TaxID=51028 RepID=A0A0N4V9E8_ENTVE|nr:unnamed protein product [Enterobius vermicularis]